MARPTYEEMVSGMTEEELNEMLKPVSARDASHQTSTVTQVWGG